MLHLGSLGAVSTSKYDKAIRMSLSMLMGEQGYGHGLTGERLLVGGERLVFTVLVFKCAKASHSSFHATGRCVLPWSFHTR